MILKVEDSEPSISAFTEMQIIMMIFMRTFDN